MEKTPFGCECGSEDCGLEALVTDEEFDHIEETPGYVVVKGCMTPPYSDAVLVEDHGTYAIYFSPTREKEHQDAIGND